MRALTNNNPAFWGSGIACRKITVSVGFSGRCFIFRCAVFIVPIHAPGHIAEIEVEHARGEHQYNCQQDDFHVSSDK
jgi:hypothetical protein